MSRFLGLPRSPAVPVRVHRDVEVVTRDGVVLRGDHWEPRRRGAPTVLVRTPYGRRGVTGLATGRVFAERGFHVLLQSCRGTFDSGGGGFTPMRYEREDGLDTLAWLKTQPWFTGELYTYGPSYLGFTQWALAAPAGDALRGMLLSVTASGFRDPTYAGGAFSLDTTLNWATLTANQGGSTVSFMYRQNRAQARLRRAWTHLPLSEVDTVAAGREIAFLQEWLRHTDQADPYWASREHTGTVAGVTAPVSMVGGWHDLFLPWQLRDYAALRAAGRTPRLVIGPWTHASLGLHAEATRSGLEFFQALHRGEPAPTGVRVYVAGTGRWRDLPDWPPHGATQPWYLHPGGGLSTTAPAVPAAPSTYRYDPADPTPSPGGPLLTRAAGVGDNRPVERRADVLVHTGEVLAHDLEAIGPVHATVHIRSTVEHFDVFVRLCDVHPSGRSENVCDGLVRVGPGRFEPDADGVRAVPVELWPTAYRWRAGHRVRVQLASAAHPRYARNTGTGEPLATATALVASTQEVFHDPARPSAVHLPAG